MKENTPEWKNGNPGMKNEHPRMKIPEWEWKSRNETRMIFSGRTPEWKILWMKKSIQEWNENGRNETRMKPGSRRTPD